MLKQIQVKNKLIPVPVPIKDVEQALLWAEKTLVIKGEIVTKVVLNGTDLLAGDSVHNFSDIQLDDKSTLMLQVDSPKVLALQLLDSINKISKCVHDDMKPLAVECWQINKKSTNQKIETIQTDIEIALDLIDHLTGLIDASHIEAAPVQGIAILIEKVLVSLTAERLKNDWKRCARILLNRVEPLLNDLAREADDLQVQIFASTDSMSDQTAL
jgi:hypothetical protein